jgi:hypothetical protein
MGDFARWKSYQVEQFTKKVPHYSNRLASSYLFVIKEFTWMLVVQYENLAFHYLTTG